MTLAADTRAAVRARPFLLESLRAGVVNYAAAARSLGISDDHDAVATALRRFADQLPPLDVRDRRASLTMQSGLERVEPGVDGILRVGGAAFAPGEGDLTGVVATGDVDAAALAHALGVLRAADVPVTAAGCGGDALVLVVDRRAGPEALRQLEVALDAVPNPTG